MKLTGKEKASLCVEKEGKPYFTICQLNWHQLLNDFICGKIWNESKKNNKIEELDTRYITINNLKIPKEAKIKVAFQISTKATPETVVEKKYENSFKVKDFYNKMIQLFKDFSNKYNTTIWNIGFELIEFEIIEGKPVTKIKVFCSDNDNFKDYIPIIKKYSMDEITIQKDEEYYRYYIDLDVKSFNFLPKLEQDLLDINDNIEGLIFSSIEEAYYKLEIYDGYRE